jgi:asparagine synthase (glutamine-hydrolysing)
MNHLIGSFGKAASNFFHERFSNLDDRMIKIESKDSLFCAIAQHDEQLDAITIANQDGLLLGNVFDRKTYAPINHFEDYIQPHLLMNKYWGRFSGVMYNQANKSISLVRDPLGIQTLFYTKFRDGLLFSSSLSPLIDLLDHKPKLNWQYFAEFLVEQNFVVPQTPLKNVSELLPGMHLKTDLHGAEQHTFEWQIPTQHMTDEHHIVETVLDKLKKSTKAWVGSNKKITLQLSGGVDSSSILCLLKEIAPHIEIQAIHFNDKTTKASQEISHAEKIARECNIELIKMEFEDTKFFEPIPSFWKPDKPSTGMTGFRSIQTFENYAKDSLVMSGQGGDHVFLAPPPEESIADYWLDNGLRGISGITHQLSSVYRTSWLSLMKQNVGTLKNYYLKRTNNNQYNLNNPMFSPAFASTIKLAPFYLQNRLKGFPPAKAKQIETLYHAIAYLDQIDKKIVTYPLLSLPVVECALQIPTYMSIKNGYNRYFLRKAINKINDTQVIWRRDKGEVSASVIKKLKNEFEPLHELIMNGMLLNNGVLNKEWVTSRLNHIRHGNPQNLIEIFRIVGAELWLKQWQYS